LLPHVERKYAGYVTLSLSKTNGEVAWRGTVLETRVSETSEKTFVEKFSFFFTEGVQVYPILVYF